MADESDRRWTDPNKLIMALAVIVLAFVSWWGTLVYGMARAAELANARQDQEIQELMRFAGRVDDKLSRLLERK